MIKIKSLKLNLGSFYLENIDLEIQSGEYFIILGPTGAGKSIMLEALAGLHPLIEGKIEVNGKDITNFPPERRKIGIVYQDYSLFPHMSVYENIA
ncbi:ATP-binding cassette domain-containing protein, partial [candidate division WOR-3 bacterium]|nr:ATP-binding cassette domain-containing protein [candidate division WOR-3 bacterium]